jgi:SET domain-containing protein
MTSYTFLLKPSPIHGTGAFATRAISKDAGVVEYVGDRISKTESLRRCEQNNQFIFALSDEIDLDGNVDWNPARFLNHSCEPNCEALLEDDRVWIVAIRDIAAGEELTFNYGFDLEDYQLYPCRCGAASCIGYILSGDFFDHVRKQRLS